MKKILLSLILLCTPFSSHAVNSKVQTAYSKFEKAIEQNYSQEQQLFLLQQVRDKIREIQFQWRYSDKSSLTYDLQALNNEKLFSIWKESELSTSRQKVQELRERKTLEKSLTRDSHPSEVQSLIDSWFTFLSTNESREFVSGDSIKRVIHTRFYPINSSTVSQLRWLEWIIIYDGASNQYQFIEDYSFEEKIPYSELTSKFKAYITDSYKVLEENGKIYGYNFLSTKFYSDKYGVYQKNLDSSGFNYNSTLLLQREDGWYSFVKDYSTYEIANASDVFGVSEKHLFLDYLREDSKYPSTNISSELGKMKSLSRSLTQWKDYREGLDSIYAWILENVSYSRDIDLADQQIFSGLEAFKTGSWVCTWYTKLSSYLLYYAGYYDVEVIRGHVIDAQDFPQIGHAWLKIWDLYYDPTFDDPIGATTTKSADEYKYFWLPKDVFYANRYDFGTLPSYLKTASKSDIETHIFNNLKDLLPKYNTQLDQYPVFWKIAFKILHGIPATTTITPNLLAQKIGSFTVINNSFTFSDNGTQRSIAWLRYYTLDDSNTEAVLDLLWYKMDKLTLFNWQIEDGSRVWRLAYELELR